MPEPRVGFIGLGIMGAPMAANLARAACPLVVHNLSRPKVEQFVTEHNAAEAAATPKEVAERADVVITIAARLARRRAGLPGRGRRDLGGAGGPAPDRHELDRAGGGAGRRRRGFCSQGFGARCPGVRGRRGRARGHADLGIALRTARELDVFVPTTAIVDQMLAALEAAGEGELDHSALLTVIEQQSSHRINPRPRG
jgi:hypothetical protein